MGIGCGFMVLMASLLVIKAHVPRVFTLPADRRSGQAGTGGARGRAIRAGSCPKIRRDTATCAIGKAT